MIELYISGNAGNQYCQYAFARYLMVKRNRNENLKINWKNYFQNGKERKYPDCLEGMETIKYDSFESRIKGFILPRIIVRGDKLLRRELDYDQLAGNGIYMHPNGVETEVISQKKNILIQGNYEIPKYFDYVRTEILDELRPKESMISPNVVEMGKAMENSESLCLSVRVWGKDVLSDRRIQLEPAFFNNAISLIKNKIGHDFERFFISSNDIDWCKANLNLKGNVIFDSSEWNIYEKIYIMSRARYFVLSNSTFSWWIQYLCKRDDKVVISPYIKNFGLFQWKTAPGGGAGE